MSGDKPEKAARKHPRSIWLFYRHGYGKAFRKSFDKYGWLVLVFSLLYTVIDILVSSKAREEKFWGFDMSFWLTFAVPGALLVFVLIYHLFRAPYEIYKEEFEKHQNEVGRLETEVQKLATELQALKDSRPELELLAGSPIQNDRGLFLARIILKNKSATGAANSVRVEMLEITPKQKLERRYATPYGFVTESTVYPIVLEGSELRGDILYPASHIEYDLFEVFRQYFKERPGLALISTDIPQKKIVFDRENNPRKYVLAGFNMEWLDGKPSENGYKKYSVKIRACATGVVPIERMFDVVFDMDEKRTPVQIIAL